MLAVRKGIKVMPAYNFPRFAYDDGCPCGACGAVRSADAELEAAYQAERGTIGMMKEKAWYRIKVAKSKKTEAERMALEVRRGK